MNDPFLLRSEIGGTVRRALPILAVCGWKKSGKTALIEELLTVLRGKGLSLAVVKHDSHGIEIDRPGKDSDRFFMAGADVLLQGPGETAFRSRFQEPFDLEAGLALMAPYYDLILVEGHKETALPKVWLRKEGGEPRPESAREVLLELPPGPGRLSSMMGFLEGWLSERVRRAPVLGCLLVGGSSRRMGAPKHLIEEEGKTWIEKAAELLGQVTDQAVLAGKGRVPASLSEMVRLSDAPGVQGPMAGILAAMRWHPWAGWLVAACDMPDLSLPALEWLLSRRKPGIWAVLPRAGEGEGSPQPLLAFYDFRAKPWFEQKAAAGVFRLREIVRIEKADFPAPPAPLARAWKNYNTREDLKNRGSSLDY